MRYEHLRTRNRRTLGGGDCNRQAERLEAGEWERVYPLVYPLEEPENDNDDQGEDEQGESLTISTRPAPKRRGRKKASKSK